MSHGPVKVGHFKIRIWMKHRWFIGVLLYNDSYYFTDSDEKSYLTISIHVDPLTFLIFRNNRYIDSFNDLLSMMLKL